MGNKANFSVREGLSPKLQALNPLTDDKGKITKLRIVTSAVVVAAVVVAIIFGIKYAHAQNRANQLSSNPQTAAQAAVQKAVNDIGKLVVLPSDETPTLATVSDATKLKAQAFFANAQNGDKILIYTQAKTAILYRPSVNKIINIAPLTLGSGTDSSSGTSTTKR